MVFVKKVIIFIQSSHGELIRCDKNIRNGFLLTINDYMGCYKERVNVFECVYHPLNLLIYFI